MSDYAPSLMDGQNYYVTGRAQIQRQITGEHAQDITPYSAEFDRMIAQVRAETLREAREALIADQINRYGIVLPDVNDAVDLLAERADQIEKEAGL